MARKLTPKQQRFVEEYLLDLNATQACIRAGYKSNRADAQGYENLRKPEIADAISTQMQERSERTKIDADWLLKRLADDVTADLADLYYEAGGMKPVHEWPLIWRQGLVAGVEVEQQYVYQDGKKQPDGFVTKIKVSDRVKRLEMVGRHVDVQAFKDRLEVEDTTDYAALLERRANAAERLRNSAD